MFSKSIVLVFLAFMDLSLAAKPDYCSGYNKSQKNSIYGDALLDAPGCLSRSNEPYPSQRLERLLPQLKRMYRGTNSREGREMFTKVQSPDLTRQELLHYHTLASQGRVDDISASIRQKRQATENKPTTTTTTPETTTTMFDDKQQTCVVPDNEVVPARLCKSIFNTTAPMYGVSLTSGEPVTIVQIFPDLLQQVVYEMCDSKECDLVHGECVQTYVPYLFLVIPLGPVTLTGQDYVLVESGCSCRPKYSRPGSEPNPAAIIPNF